MFLCTAVSMLDESRCIHIFWPRRARGVRCVPSIWLAGRSTGVSGLDRHVRCETRLLFAILLLRQRISKAFQKRESYILWPHARQLDSFNPSMDDVAVKSDSTHSANCLNWKWKLKTENENWKCLRLTFEHKQVHLASWALFCQKC